MTDQEFLRIENAINGEGMDKVEQLTMARFTGRELKEYLEEVIRIHNEQKLFDCAEKEDMMRSNLGLPPLVGMAEQFQKESSINKCKSVAAWIGKCNKEADGSGYCKEHTDMKCTSCGKQATRTCDETFQLVCGYPLCDSCGHHDPENKYKHVPKNPLTKH